MVDQGPPVDAQCPSWAASLGYMGVAAAVCLSNWGSAVSTERDIIVHDLERSTIDENRKGEASKYEVTIIFNLRRDIRIKIILLWIIGFLGLLGAQICKRWAVRFVVYFLFYFILRRLHEDEKMRRWEEEDENEDEDGKKKYTLTWCNIYYLFPFDFFFVQLQIGTWKSGQSIIYTGIRHPSSIMKNVIPIVMAGGTCFVPFVLFFISLNETTKSIILTYIHI
jgi:hypothetical protein